MTATVHMSGGLALARADRIAQFNAVTDKGKARGFFWH